MTRAVERNYTILFSNDRMKLIKSMMPMANVAVKSILYSIVLTKKNTGEVFSDESRAMVIIGKDMLT